MPLAGTAAPCTMAPFIHFDTGHPMLLTTLLSQHPEAALDIVRGTPPGSAPCWPR
jgi:hypothetical protein